MEIKVRKKSFDIDFMGVEAVQLFNELMAVDAGEFDVSKPEKAIAGLLKRRGEVAEIALKCVDVILDGNDIEFDPKWWNRKVSVSDIIGFLVEIYKNEIGVDVKKNLPVKEN